MRPEDGELALGQRFAMLLHAKRGVLVDNVPEPYATGRFGEVSSGNIAVA